MSLEDLPPGFEMFPVAAWLKVPTKRRAELWENQRVFHVDDDFGQTEVWVDSEALSEDERLLLEPNSDSADVDAKPGRVYSVSLVEGVE